MDAVDERLESLAERLDLVGASGFIREGGSADPVRQRLYARAEANVPHFRAAYFAGDEPVVYFAAAPELDAHQRAAVHRAVWNDGRAPLLVVLTRGDIRVYDAFATPASNPALVDQEPRLLRYTQAITGVLDALQRRRLDSGAFAKSFPGAFREATRCDMSLIRDLRYQRDLLVGDGLAPEDAHRLLTRVILTMYLEHRGALSPRFIARVADGAQSVNEVLSSKKATYQLFDSLADHFNGGLFTSGWSERRRIRADHLQGLARCLRGEDPRSGQLVLWPMYDFSVIPVGFISAIYESLLHSNDAKEKGAYYTPLHLVEMLLDEVLPWPNSTETDPPTVLDPACGSGIFLVEAYRRLVAHAQLGEGRPLSAAQLRSLLVGHLFGIDTDASTLQVAAFSLCLAMLDHLEPRHIWANVRFPDLLGTNLRVADAFTLGDDETYDLVVGNPPWGRSASATSQKWCAERGYTIAKEASQAFLCLGTEHARERVAMLLSSKWLFNKEGPDRMFRESIFEQFGVETIINFSPLHTRRAGHRKLFRSVKVPASAVVLRVDGKGADDRTLYLSPKNIGGDIPGRAIQIDPADICWLDHDRLTHPFGLKLFAWGHERDFALMERLFVQGPSLSELADARGWKIARGLQTPTDSTPAKTIKTDPELAALPHVPTKKLERFVATKAVAESLDDDLFSRTGPREIYTAPHVLMKEGHKNRRLCAAFAGFDCSFRDSIVGIAGPADDEEMLMALTALLCSNVAAYWLFLSSASWGVDRGRTKRNEIASIPCGPLADADAVGHLATAWRSASTAHDDDDAQRIVDRATAMVFGLAPHEIALIEDMVGVVVDYLHRAVNSRGMDRATTQDLTVYAETVVEVLEPFFPGKETRLAAVVRPRKRGTPMVSIYANAPRDAERVRIEGAADDALRRLGWRLDVDGPHRLTPRHARMYSPDAVHFLKPPARYFWTRSTALRDADDVFAEALLETRE